MQKEIIAIFFPFWKENAIFVAKIQQKTENEGRMMKNL